MSFERDKAMLDEINAVLAKYGRCAPVTGVQYAHHSSDRTYTVVSMTIVFPDIPWRRT